jgi:hypothetical protein
MTNETQFPTLGFPDESAELPPPTQIGEFKILSVLGRGGMQAQEQEALLAADATSSAKN